MGLVIPQKTYPHRRNAYSLSCLQQSRLQWSGIWDEIVFPATANLNFWSRATFGTYHFWKKCTDPDRKWHANPIHLWFLSYLGWFSCKPMFGINTHTFIFQVGHPIKTLWRMHLRLHTVCVYQSLNTCTKAVKFHTAGISFVPRPCAFGQSGNEDKLAHTGAHLALFQVWQFNTLFEG